MDVPLEAEGKPKVSDGSHLNGWQGTCPGSVVQLVQNKKRKR